MATKRRTPQKLVCMNHTEYAQLKRAKDTYEADTGQRTDWGGFLLFLGLAYLMGKGMQQQSQQQQQTKRKGVFP